MTVAFLHMLRGECNNQIHIQWLTLSQPVEKKSLFPEANRYQLSFLKLFQSLTVYVHLIPPKWQCKKNRPVTVSKVALQEVKMKQLGKTAILVWFWSSTKAFVHHSTVGDFLSALLKNRIII